MLPQGGDLHVAASPGGHHLAGYLAPPVAFQLPGVVVQPHIPAHIEGIPRPQGLRHIPGAPQQGIVPVKDGGTAGAGVAEYFQLGLQGVLPTAKGLDMGVANVGDAHHIGLGDGRKITHLSRVVDAQFHHGDLMVTVQPQQGHGKADIVILVALGFQHIVLFTEDGGHHVLGGGLAHAARHRHHRDIKTVFIPHRQIPQCPVGGFHLDVEFSGQITLPLPLGQTARRSGLQSAADIGVAVKTVAGQGQKQRPL